MAITDTTFVLLYGCKYIFIIEIFFLGADTDAKDVFASRRKKKREREKMTIKKMYEAVNLRTPIDERTFFEYFNESVAELVLKFKAKYIFTDDEKEKNPQISSLNEDNPIFDLYHIAVLYNILYLCGLGDAYKTMFLSYSEEANLQKEKERDTKGDYIRSEGW